MKITPEPTPRNVLYPSIAAAAVTAAAALASCQPEQEQALSGAPPQPASDRQDTPPSDQNAGDATKTATDPQPSPDVTEQILGGDVVYEPEGGDSPTDQPDNS